MAHLHCIEHGKRVVVVPFEYTTAANERRNAGSFMISVALHRNGGKSTERCHSDLRIGRTNSIKVTTEDVGGGILSVLNVHRLGRPQKVAQTSR